jgi:glycine cleavage system H protein
MSLESFRGHIPDDTLYAPEYDMWVTVASDGAFVTIGVTTYGIHIAGEIIGFTAKPKGARVERGRGLGTVECAKTILAVHAPIGFDLIAANEAAEEQPAVLNRDPYGAGWMVRGHPHNWDRDAAHLIDAATYRVQILRSDPAALFE